MKFHAPRCKAGAALGEPLTVGALVAGAPEAGVPVAGALVAGALVAGALVALVALVAGARAVA